MNTFTTPGGRTFTVGAPEEDHPPHVHPSFYSIVWRITNADGREVGAIYQTSNYGRTPSGGRFFQGSLSKLIWMQPEMPPTGVGFDVGPEATMERVLERWGRNADQVLDWTDGKPVHASYPDRICRREVPRAR